MKEYKCTSEAILVFQKENKKSKKNQREKSCLVYFAVSFILIKSKCI